MYESEYDEEKLLLSFVSLYIFLVKLDLSRL